MTVAALVFDPFSADILPNPYENHGRVWDEAPVCYSTDYEFYALTRQHVDVAAAFRDYESVSSFDRVDLVRVRTGVVAEHGSIIASDPSARRRMCSRLNKVFTPRAIQDLRSLVANLIEKHLAAVDPVGFGFVQDFSALFPVEVVATMQGVPQQDHQQVPPWIGRLLHRQPGEVEMPTAGGELGVATAMYYYRPNQITSGRARR